ncbi:Type IV secretion system protein virB8 [Rickettsiales bacterium Ac37b]|nr:Type IV secretion system protein virB8 [Rickettsiales bacterium Ac37b]
MDEINKSLLNNLKSGQYYHDGRLWYMRKYIYPILERSLLTFLFAIIAVTFLLISYAIYTQLPLKKIVPILVKIQNLTEDISVIHSIEYPNESTSISLAKYLASKYIIWRESYSYADIDTQINKIKNNSTKFVFKQFYNSLSLENANSPVLLYQQYITRSINIESVAVSNQAQSIIVKFSATIKDTNSGSEEKSLWLANISYDMSDIELIMKKNAPLNFLVTDYNVQEIK